MRGGAKAKLPPSKGAATRFCEGTDMGWRHLMSVEPCCGGAKPWHAFRPGGGRDLGHSPSKLWCVRNTVCPPQWLRSPLGWVRRDPLLSALRARRCNKYVGVDPPPEIGEAGNYIIVPEH